MRASDELEQAINTGMLVSARISDMVKELIRIAERNPSRAMAEYLLGVAQQLRQHRGDINQINRTLDRALYTVQGKGADYEFKDRK